MNPIFVYITCKNKEEAKKIAEHLLKKKIIACANFFPIESMYWWNEKIINEKEFVLIVKSINSNFEKIKQEAKTVHSYKIPCITKINVEPNSEYFSWLMKQLK